MSRLVLRRSCTAGEMKVWIRCQKSAFVISSERRETVYITPETQDLNTSGPHQDPYMQKRTTQRRCDKWRLNKAHGNIVVITSIVHALVTYSRVSHNSERWYSTSYLEDSPREILIICNTTVAHSSHSGVEAGVWDRVSAGA